MTARPELKPCPFCGEAPVYHERQDEDWATHDQVIFKSISCLDCDISIECPDGYDCGTAVERWNKRANT